MAGNENRKSWIDLILGKELALNGRRTVMNINSRRSRSAILILGLIIIFSTPTLRLVSAQAITPTMTFTFTLPNTPTPTVTPTTTPSVTPTATSSPTETFTPTYAVATDIAEIKDMLNKIDTNTSNENHFSRFFIGMGEDNIYTAVWEYATKPLLARLIVGLASLASLPLVGRFLPWLPGLLTGLGINRQATSGNDQKASAAAVSNVKPGDTTAQSPKSERRNVLSLALSFVNLLILILIITLFIPFAFTPNPRSPVSQPLVSTPGAQNILATAAINPTVAPQLGSQPVATQTNQPDNETSPEHQMMLLITAETMAIGLLLFFVFYSAKLAKNLPKIFYTDFSKFNLPEAMPFLLPAGFMMLILVVLPYPVETILLPLLMPFLLFAFFDTVRVYPNIYFKKLVISHYSKIIFGAEFGAWFGFLSVLENYANPFLNIYLRNWNYIIAQIIEYPFPSDLPFASLLRTDNFRDSIRSLPMSIWSFAPILLAIILTIRPWRLIKEASKINQIAKIEASTDMT